MAAGSGLDGQLMVKPEASWGTALVPDHPFEFDSETLAGVKNTVQGMGIRPGGRYPRESRRTVSSRDVNGGWVMDVPDVGFGVILHAHFGTSAIALHSGETTVWDQTHTPGGLVGNSLTVQKGVPQSDGTVVPYTYDGCKVTDLEFTMALNANLKVAVTVDGRRELSPGSTPAGLTLATFTPPASAGVFSFLNGAITLNGSPVLAITQSSLKSTRGLKQDRFYIGGGGYKAEQLENAYASITGALQSEFTSRATLYDVYYSDATVGLVLDFVGRPIGTAAHAELKLTVPAIKLNGEPPKVGGPDVVRLNAPYVGLDPNVSSPGSPVITALFTSTDAAY